MADVARLRPAESSNIYDVKDAAARTGVVNMEAVVRALRDEVRPVPKGGTGVSSLQNNQVVIGSGGAKLKTTEARGTGALQRSSTIDAPVFDILPVSLGGTGGRNREEALTKLGAVSVDVIKNYAKNNLVSHEADGLMAAKDKVTFDEVTTAAASTVVLGNGTVKDIETFFVENADALRRAIGLPTTEHMGLVKELVDG